MIEQQVDITPYKMMLKRRKWAFIISAGLVFFIMAAIAFLLPPSYKSEATILVEAQEIPEQMVQSTVTGHVEERIQSINQVVMSRANLMKIIEEHGLYQEMRGRSTADEMVEKMRKDISMTPLQAEVANPQSGRTGLATIAFTLAYENKDPRKAQQIANILVSLFLEENARQREEKAQTTVTFLENQLAQIDETISSLENKLAEFKDENMLVLPELRDLNIQMLHRLEDRIDYLLQEIKTHENRRIYLEGQLAGIEPFPKLSTEQHLEQLQNEYIMKRASLSDKHPDVIRLKKSVEALEMEDSKGVSLQQAIEAYEVASLELSMLQQQYSPKHPDVIRKTREFKELGERIDRLNQQKAIQRVKEDVEKEPDNPAYLSLQAQIKSTEFDIRLATLVRADLQAKHKEIKERIEQTPRVEQEYRTLMRNYQNATSKYLETNSRLMLAREAKDLESDRISQKLTLIDPPALPEVPFKPNRLALLVLGLILSMGSGVGFVSLREFLDNSVHSPQELVNLFTVPLLTAIPYLETIHDRQIRFRIKMGMAAGFLVFVIGGLLAVHFLFRPLDLIWIQVQQKLRFMI
jgi:polysaccharide biosynthesis transport protein